MIHVVEFCWCLAGSKKGVSVSVSSVCSGDCCSMFRRNVHEPTLTNTCSRRDMRPDVMSKIRSQTVRALPRTSVDFLRAALKSPLGFWASCKLDSVGSPMYHNSYWDSKFWSFDSRLDITHQGGEQTRKEGPPDILPGGSWCNNLTQLHTHESMILVVATRVGAILMKIGRQLLMFWVTPQHCLSLPASRLFTTKDPMIPRGDLKQCSEGEQLCWWTADVCQKFVNNLRCSYRQDVCLLVNEGSLAQVLRMAAYERCLCQP